MKHFVGTRFNLKSADWSKNKNGNDVLTETWLKQRFDIFEKFCLPAMKNQDTNNFIWCLFFDVSTPQVFKDRISKLIKGHANFYAVYIDGMNALGASFKSFVSDNITLPDQYIITTRIDNDDFVASNFISLIQSLAKPIDKFVIDLQNGYQLTTDANNYELRDYHHPYNAFISVVEHVDTITTVYLKQHYHWEELNTAVKYTKQTMWVEVSHTENFVNHRQIKLKLAYSIDTSRFDLPISLHFSFYKILINNSYLFLQDLSKKIKQLFYKISKLPYRVKRYLKKKIKFYALEYGLVKSNSKWPYMSKRLKQKFINEVNLLSSEETLDIIKKAIESKKAGAYLRFGDGDVLLMMGENDCLHDVNSSLSQEMSEAFKIQGDYIHKSLPINSNIFGFENKMTDGLNLVRDIDALKYLSVTYKDINLKQIFSTVALHHLSTINSAYCIAFLKFLKSKNPVFVGNHNIDKNIVDKLFGTIHIKTPSSNSYNEIDRIEHELIDILDQLNDFKVIVVAMGCPGRVLQKRIINKGYNVYLFDFGSLLDAFNGEQTRAWVRLTGGVNSYMDLLNKI